MKGGLKDFIARLERLGEVVRICARVDPALEITEIADRICKSPDGGKALLFENTGTRFPLLINMFGSRRRISLALGVEDMDALSAEIEKLFADLVSPKPTLRAKLGALPALLRLSRILPRHKRGRGACQQVVLRGEDARLSLLPVLQCWPHDGGRFVTLPLVHTVDPDTGAPNVGMYRMQVFDEQTAGLHWHLHKTGERHYRAWQRHGGRMPVSVALGGDPAYTYAATAPMPDGMDEYLLAGYLRRRSVRLVKCLTNNIRVPEDCDIVIEGYVDTAEPKRTEGPFGDHTGFYSLEDPYPVMHVTAITHRRDAVYPATIVGVPPMEDFLIGMATEKIFLAPVRFALQPEVRDLWMPAPGVAHNLLVTGIEESYPGQAFKVAGALWGAGQMSFNKVMVVTGAPFRDLDALAAGLRSARLPDDILLSQGLLDVLDHATSTPGRGGKLAIDLTPSRIARPLHLAAELRLCHGIEAADTALAEKWGVVVLFAKPEAQIDAAAFIVENGIEGVTIFVIIDTKARELTYEELLWFALANCEPGRDVAVSASGGYIVADARTKLPGAPGMPARWPGVVASLPETIAAVDRRWAEYGLGELLNSPSLRYLPIVYSKKAEI